MFVRRLFFTWFTLVGSAFAQQTLPTVSDPYVTWAIAQWGAAVVNDPTQEATVWGPNANPDGDAFTNLQEYAFGTNPNQFTPNPVVTDMGQTVPGYIGITAQQRVDDPALIVFPQYSDDMQTWWPPMPLDSFSYSGSNSYFWNWTQGPVSNGMRNVAQVCSVPINSVASLFVRLVVMRNNALAVGSSLDTLKLFGTTTGISGGVVDSNTLVLTGFTGSVNVSVAGGADLIVNGVDVGTSASVAAGSTIRLRTTSPTSAGSTTNTLNVGNYSTSWNVTTSPIAALQGISGTPSGYTAVSASVGDSGAASISIPITVPPAAGGMEPKLALTYSSQGGNGLLGVGFGLSGLSAITRTGSVQYLDGMKSGVSFGPNDRFAVDGQRLILINGTSGGDGAEYRTEIDSFSQVTSQGTTTGGPLSWIVKTKAGLTYEYGTSTDSRILADRSSVPGDTAVLMWALTRITDNTGNTIEFNYEGTDDADHGCPVIASISYGKNNAAGIQSYDQILFDYARRSDVRTSYVGGAKIVVSKIITGIRCAYGGNISRGYALTYQQAEISGNSQLTQVVESGKQPGDGSAAQAFPPTTFTWQQSAGPKMTMETSAQVPSLGKMAFSQSPQGLVLQGDFRGDGHMGLMGFDNTVADTWVSMGKSDGTFDYYTAGGSFNAGDAISPTTARIRTGDFNGDGKTDVLHISTSGTNDWLALSNGDGTFNVLRGAQLGALQNLTQSGDFNTEILTLDLNGDGRTDVVYLESHGNNRVFLGNGDGSFTEKVLPANDPFRTFKISNNNSRFTWVLPGDYNGDGLGDILLLYYLGSHVLALSNGDGTFTVRSGAQLGGINGQTFANTYAYLTSGDFNGDGLTDVFCDNTAQAAWQALCKGDGTFETVTTLPSLSNLPVSDPQYTHLYTGDLNADGFSEVYGRYSGHQDLTWLTFSLGDGTYASSVGAAIGALDSAVYYDPEHYPDSQVFVGDFDGDGTDDVLDLNYDKNNFLSRSNGFTPSRIVQVTNGHGGYTKFNYKPLTDPTVYTKGTTAVYPNYDVIGAMYVVSSAVTRNGIDGDAFTVQANPALGESTTTYTYERAWSILDGHGFQGFAAVQSTDVDTGIISRTEYGNTDPTLSGRPTLQEQMLGTGQLISQTTTQWVSSPIAQPNGAVTHFPTAVWTVENQYEINSPAGSGPYRSVTYRGVAYDSYGNQTNSTTDFGGGILEVAESTFVNDTTHWWLGRLQQTNVTEVSPSGQVSRTSTFDYSPTNGQLIEETIVTPESSLVLQKTYQHDAFGNIVQSTLTDVATGENRTTATTYTADGRFVALTQNSVGQVETKTYDPLNGTVLTQTGPNGLTTSWTYDEFGRPLTESRADGTQTITQYLLCGPGNGVPPRAVHCVTSQSSGGPPNTVYFDVLDRQIRSDGTGFDGTTVSVQTVFDVRGQKIQVSQPFFANSGGLYTQNQFDAIGRLTLQTAPGNRVTSTAYAGLTDTVTNPKNETFTSVEDIRGSTASGTSFGTDTVTNTHDPYGNLLKVDDGNGHVTTMSYDGRGQKISMTEPNSGKTNYTYDAFGEMISQTDSLNRTTQFFYDPLGRLVRRLDPEGSVTVETDWQYDTAPNGVGKLASVYRESDGYQEGYRYDTQGRLTETLTQVGAMQFVTSTTFDEFSRPDTITYPTGFAVRNSYNVQGHLASVYDAATPALTYWTAVTVNARGQVEEENFGNGLITRRAYDPNTGLLQTVLTGPPANGEVWSSVQNFAYQFDNIGNLTQRQDGNAGITENFTYDGRNQLSGITSNASDPVTIACDQFGNIATRSDVGTYTYGESGAGPHAVTSITDVNGVTQRTLHYDAAGNCTQDGLTVLAYNSSNQPTEIRSSNSDLFFSYTPSHTRYRLLQQLGTGRTEKLYIGGLYERDDIAGAVIHTHFIPAGGGVVAIHSQSQTLDANSNTVTTSKTRYVHKDHLGSVQALTTETGSIDEALYFDAWGRRRALDRATLHYTYASVTSQTDRGFTGHEMLDAVSLIHMNGRIYDPTIGRFLSVDPLVQEPENLQNYNRYSYVLNNPLSLTDPSGFSFLGGIGKWLGKNWKIVAAVGVGVVTGGFAAWAVVGFSGSIFSAVTTGGVWAAVAGGAGYGFGSAFTGTLLSGGSLGDALRAGAVSGAWGAVAAGAAYGVGSAFKLDSLSEYSDYKPLVHGVVQGEIGTIEGGKFTHGFFSATFAAFADDAIGDRLKTYGVGARTAVAAVVGGTAERLGGGKFANGAVTGAFVHLFNNENHPAEQNDRDFTENVANWSGNASFGLDVGGNAVGGMWGDMIGVHATAIGGVGVVFDAVNLPPNVYDAIESPSPGNVGKASINVLTLTAGSVALATGSTVLGGAGVVVSGGYLLITRTNAGMYPAALIAYPADHLFGNGDLHFNQSLIDDTRWRIDHFGPGR